MIQAYRRGFLKPDYPHGERSRIRENLMLDLIDAEDVFELAKNKIQVAASVIGPAPMDSHSRQRVSRRLGQDLRYFDLIRELAFDKADEYRFLNSELALVKAYEILEREGLMDAQETEQPDEQAT